MYLTGKSCLQESPDNCISQREARNGISKLNLVVALCVSALDLLLCSRDFTLRFWTDCGKSREQTFEMIDEQQPRKYNVQ